MIKVFQINLVILISCLNLVRCTAENILTREDLIKSENLLSFSFNRICLNDFQCSFSDDILSDISFKTRPFYYNKPVKNLLSTFCFFFQYSQIRNNEKLRDIVEKIFKFDRSHIQKYGEVTKEYVFDQNSFTLHIFKFDDLINDMLKKKSPEWVYIEEKDERIIITQNNFSFANFNLHLIENFLDIKFEILGNIKTVDVLFEFYTRFYEMYLEDKLEPKFSVSLNAIYKQESKYKRIKESKLIIAPKDSFKELKNIFRRFCQLVNIEANILWKEQGKYFEIFAKYQSIAMKMHLSRKMPVYLSELLLKGRAKYFYECSDEKSEIGSFLYYLEESKEDIFKLRDLLKKLLLDPEVVSFVNTKLSSESLDNLVKNCLELIT